MNNIITKASIASTIAIALFAVGSIAWADTVTGDLSTGLRGGTGDGVDGVVIAPPIANPPAGSYASAQSVTLTADGSTGIHYTTDGTAPDCSTGTTYSGAISVAASEPIEAISCYDGGRHSTVASYLYAINIPAITPTGGGGGGGGGGGSSVPNTALFSKGDANRDGQIGISDFVILMADWGQTGSGNSADFNSDGKVDIMDFVALMANWTN